MDCNACTRLRTRKRASRGSPRGPWRVGEAYPLFFGIGASLPPSVEGRIRLGVDSAHWAETSSGSHRTELPADGVGRDRRQRRAGALPFCPISATRTRAAANARALAAFQSCFLSSDADQAGPLQPKSDCALELEAVNKFVDRDAGKNANSQTAGHSRRRGVQHSSCRFEPALYPSAALTAWTIGSDTAVVTPYVAYNPLMPCSPRARPLPSRQVWVSPPVTLTIGDSQAGGHRSPCS